MVDMTLPLELAQPLAHYTGLILGSMVSAIISDLIVTVNSNHFGKVFFDNHFISFKRLFGYILLLLGFFAILFDFLSPHIDAFLVANLKFYVGISALILGLFFTWFVHAFDYDIRTQWKWLFAVICFIIAEINVALVLSGII